MATSDDKPISQLPLLAAIPADPSAAWVAVAFSGTTYRIALSVLLSGAGGD